ncbi:hypothetical protein LAZ67_X004155 [Cordylochernes scorpioides]|uniref:Retrotransposon gag domain-containing protein n=1 Tax=Cordylochernes scorpioides TaxID=51811 RepID=A0ABY6LUP5_9ARAC|nr:hypothetical protein LAZ67_X004155 [Cordylochernes scorpioides]
MQVVLIPCHSPEFHCYWRWSRTWKPGGHLDNQSAGSYAGGTLLGEYHFKHIRNPSIFLGKPGQSPEKWLKEYHRVARYNCWDSSMCLANVYFFLSGTAKVWFENVEEQITSWEIFETTLSQAFGHHVSRKYQLLEKLEARAQGKGESSEAYILHE